MSLQLRCSGNGQRTIQLPELSPGPAGPETHMGSQTMDEALRWDILASFSLFFVFPSPRWTLVSLILSFFEYLKYWTDIILEALGLFDRCLHDCLCAVMSCRIASWMTLNPREMTKCKTWPSKKEMKRNKKKKKTRYLYTLMLTLRVWVVSSCLSEEDVAALQHGTVFIVIRTGFMTNNDRRLRGYVKTLFPPREIIKSLMHAVFTHHCEVFTLSLSIY